MNRSNNKYVAIKIKPSSTAIQEARMHMYLREVCNIPRFHGLLAMSDELLVGLVCELIADDAKGGHNFTLDISNMDVLILFIENDVGLKYYCSIQ